MSEKKELAPVPAVMPPRELMASRDEIVAHVRLVQQVMEAVMKQDTHYGVIPGTKRQSLWKPGAEVLGMTFRIAPSYHVEDLSTEDCLRYRVFCTGTHQLTGAVLGEGVGACSSHEEKYKWRKAVHKNEFDAAPEDRRRIKFYSDGGQVRQVRTTPEDLDNTILKMACKRAQIAMVINVTAASDIFTQDLEDLPPEIVDGMVGDGAKPPVAEPQSKSAKAAPAQPAAAPAVNQDNVAAAQSISEGAVRLLLAKLAAAALTDADLCKHFGIEKLTLLKTGQMNDALAFIQNPNGAA